MYSVYFVQVTLASEVLNTFITFSSLFPQSTVNGRHIREVEITTMVNATE